MSFCTVFKWFFAAYLLSSFKSLPGAYFVRFYYYVTQTLFLPIFTGFETENIKKLEKNEYGCFSYNKLDTYASPFECDFYFHKSNSTYFAELDISRGSLMCKIFQKLMLNSRRYPYVPVANVFTNFLKEIKPFQKYSISSNIICWNEKWIYVMSRFTIKNGTVLCSLSLTKYVLKDGRKTIKPKDALEYCGIYNEKVAKISEDNLKLLTEHCGFHETVPLENLSQDYCSEI